MKKLLSLIMAVAMIMSMGVVSFAAYIKGDVLVADGSSVDYKITGDVTPGSVIYVVIGTYNKNNPLKSVKVTPEGSESRDWVAKSSKATIVKLKDGSDRYECVEIKVKAASLNTYDEDDNYSATVFIEYEYKDNTSDDFTLSFDIAYREEYANGTISNEAALFVLEKDDELYITDDEGYITIEGEVVGNTKALAVLSTEVIDKIEDKYGDDANLEYFSFNGTFKRVKKGSLTIDLHDDDYKYLYEYKDGSLVDLSKNYDKKDECFNINFGGSSFELGTYVVSDEKLPVSASSGSVSSNGSSSTTTVPNNPMTGAVA